MHVLKFKVKKFAGEKIFNEKKLQGKRFAGWKFCDEKNLRNEKLAGWKIEVEKKFAEWKIVVREIHGVICSWSGKFAGRKKLRLEKFAGRNFILRKNQKHKYRR